MKKIKNTLLLVVDLYQVLQTYCYFAFKKEINMLIHHSMFHISRLFTSEQ